MTSVKQKYNGKEEEEEKNKQHYRHVTNLDYKSNNNWVMDNNASLHCLFPSFFIYFPPVYLPWCTINRRRNLQITIIRNKILRSNSTLKSLLIPKRGLITRGSCSQDRRERKEEGEKRAPKIRIVVPVGVIRSKTSMSIGQ